jgi:hypothetical protein
VQVLGHYRNWQRRSVVNLTTAIVKSGNIERLGNLAFFFEASVAIRGDAMTSSPQKPRKEPRMRKDVQKGWLVLAGALVGMGVISERAAAQ